jgi:hypothetical protein
MQRLRAWVEYLHNATELARACRSIHQKRPASAESCCSRDAVGSGRIQMSIPFSADLLPAHPSYVSRCANALAAARVIAIDPCRHNEILDV